jgi:exodeoxyribonuclease V gamma subunit
LPLQVFSTLTYLPQHERGIGGYQPLWARVAAASASPERVSDPVSGAGGFWQQPLPLPAELADRQRHRQILWEDVKTALRNGAEFFVRRRLRANLTPWWQEHPTEEPFALDGLEGYWLKSEQLQRLLEATSEADNAVDMAAFVRQQQALGNLPVRALGEFQSERLQQSLRPLCQALQPLLQAPVASASLLWPLDLEEQGTFTILGELQHLHDQVLVRYRPGSVRAVHLLDAWLDLLLVTAVQPGRVTSVHYLGVGKEFQHLQLLAPSPETAEILIRRYLAFYLQCWCQPSDCLPGMLWAGLTAGDDPVKAADAVRKQGGSDYGELNQPAVKRCLPGLAAALEDDEQVQEWLQQHRWVLDDLLAHLTDLQKDHDQQTDGQKKTGPANSAKTGNSRSQNTARQDEDA